jgi:hypothetical protein
MWFLLHEQKSHAPKRGSVALVAPLARDADHADVTELLQQISREQNSIVMIQRNGDQERSVPFLAGLEL